MTTTTNQEPEVRLTHLEWMYPHYHCLTGEQQARIQREIDRETTRCFDVCSNVGQLFYNVRETLWMKEMLAEELIDEGKFGKKRKKLCDNMPDFLALSLADRKKRALLCEGGVFVDVAAKIKELIDCRNQPAKGAKP